MQTSPASTIELPDGHRLGYAEFGDPAGIPVLFLADLGHSRLARHPDDALARAAGVRLITIDRPGYGASSRRPGRELAGLTADVRRLLDRLSIDRFGVLGWAGGAPYALAVAFGLGRRVGVVGLAAPLPPNDMAGPGRSTGGRFLRNPLAPVLVRRSLRRQAHAAKGTADAGLAAAMAAMPGVDRAAILATAGFAELYVEDTQQAYAQGIAGLLDDAAAVAGRWGFEPEQIGHSVHLWHGEQDEVVPLQAGAALASRFPHSALHLLPGEGHLLILSRWQDMLSTLAGELATLPAVTRAARDHNVAYEPRGTERLAPQRAPRPVPPR